MFIFDSDERRFESDFEGFLIFSKESKRSEFMWKSRRLSFLGFDFVD